jgi:hypothetical protein
MSVVPRRCPGGIVPARGRGAPCRARPDSSKRDPDRQAGGSPMCRFVGLSQNRPIFRHAQGTITCDRSFAAEWLFVRRLPSSAERAIGLALQVGAAFRLASRPCASRGPGICAAGLWFPRSRKAPAPRGGGGLGRVCGDGVPRLAATGQHSRRPSGNLAGTVPGVGGGCRGVDPPISGVRVPSERGSRLIRC